MIRLPVLVFVASLAGAGLASGQTTVTLTADRDNTLYISNIGGLSNGAGDHLFAGRTSTPETRRALLFFDVAAAIPAGSTVTAAVLRLQLSKTNAGPVDMAIHRVLQDWGEADSEADGEEGGGAPPMAGDATWIHTFFSGSFWASAGGDFDPAASAVTTVDDLGPYSWGSTQEMVQDVQGWLSAPSSNAGWLVKAVIELTASTAKRFDSKDNDTVAVRPTLEVTFTPPAASATPVGAACVGSSGAPFTLTATGLPTVPNPAFALPVSGGAPSQPALLFIAAGTTTTPQPLFSCLLHLEPTTAFQFIASGASPLGLIGLDASGAGTFAAPIPNKVGLVGAVLGVQVLALDAPSPITSNALELALF